MVAGSCIKEPHFAPRALGLPPTTPTISVRQQTLACLIFEGSEGIALRLGPHRGFVIPLNHSLFRPCAAAGETDCPHHVLRSLAIDDVVFLFLAALAQQFWALTPKRLVAVADVTGFSACPCGSSAACATDPAVVTAISLFLPLPRPRPPPPLRSRLWREFDLLTMKACCPDGLFFFMRNCSKWAIRTDLLSPLRLHRESRLHLDV